MEDGLVLSWGTVFGVLGFFGTIAVNVAIIAVWGGSVGSRLKAVESHSDKVDKIAPLEAELEALKHQIGTEFKNLREDVRELARAVQNMVLGASSQHQHRSSR